MIENPVQHDLDAVFMKSLADVGEIFIGAQTAVDLAEVPGVIPVIVGFENRVQENGVNAKVPEIVRPGRKTPDPRNTLPVVVSRRTAESDGIDLIEIL